MTTQREQMQAGLFDYTVDDAELLDACRAIEEEQEAYQRYMQAAAYRRNKVKQLAAALRDAVGEGVFEESGARVRCGEFVLTVKPRSGGGFDVPAWQSVGVASQQRG